MDETLSKVQARFAELPPDVRQAVESADLDTRVQAIGGKHQMHIDQMGKLQNEVLLVMLGFEDSSAFVNNLTGVVGLSEVQASAVATDINNEIFAPIRESLKKFSGQTQTAPAPTASAPATPPQVGSKLPPVATATTPVTPAPAAPKPQVPLAPHPHDLMLVEKTVTTPAMPPLKPEGYKTDPYREPPE